MWFHKWLRLTLHCDVMTLSSTVRKIDFYLFRIFLFLFICAYPVISSPIFSQIWICYSWINTLSAILHLYFILMTWSWSKLWLKATIQNFVSLRVMSTGAEFFSNHELTSHYLLCCISLIDRALSLKFWYVVAESLSFDE